MTVGGAPPNPETARLRQCCAELYADGWMRLLLGDSFHPGGLALTYQLGKLLDLDTRKSVLDLATGIGTSAIALTRRFGCLVTAVDWAERNLTIAAASARSSRLENPVRFLRADASQLPFRNQAFDAVVCECAYSSFADKAAVAREMRRVVRPGGRIGLSDMTRSGPLPPELEGHAATVAACLADARPEDEYVSLLESAGFSIEHVERRDEVLLELIESARKKLLGAQLLSGVGHLSSLGINLSLARSVARSCEQAVERGDLGYVVMTSTAG